MIVFGTQGKTPGGTRKFLKISFLMNLNFSIIAG
jgi:hypothetical protein